LDGWLEEAVACGGGGPPPSVRPVPVLGADAGAGAE